MKIISWNVNGIRACQKKGLKEFADKHNPDILCIQEAKSHPDQVEISLGKFSNSFVYWSLSETAGYSGTITFSKKKALNVSYGTGIYKFDREGRFVITDYGDFILFNIYFPNGSRNDSRHLFKQEFLERLLSYMKKLISQGKNLIVAGDYNTAYMDIDVFDPASLSSVSGFLPEERQWFSSFLSLGFIDVWRYFYPKKEKSYTWWSYRENARKLNRGWRIDHICVTQGLKSRLKRIEIGSEEYSSDHCPVLLELK